MVDEGEIGVGRGTGQIYVYEWGFRFLTEGLVEWDACRPVVGLRGLGLICVSLMRILVV